MSVKLPFTSKSNPLPPFETEEDFGESFWQVSFLDTITVLLCMMIILASIPSNSKESDKAGKGEFPLEVDWDIFRLNEELRVQLSDELEAEKVLLEKGEYEIRMIFTGSSFYNQGSTVLLPEGREIIRGIVEKLVTWNRQDFKIDVEGHTDSSPINTFQFPSNWELSTARASGVVKFFLDSGIPPQKLKASGFADAVPLYPEADAEGNFLPKNQDYNRRIVIRLYFE
jgi:chemotaxis protein MotB